MLRQIWRGLPSRQERRFRKSLCRFDEDRGRKNAGPGCETMTGVFRGLL